MTTPHPKVRERQTERQMKVLAFIRRYITEHRYAPSMREIGRACGINSTSIVTSDLDALEYQGYLTRNPHIARSIALTAKGVLA